MQSKPLLWFIPALLLILIAGPASAQAVYSASEDHPRLSVGAGLSMFSQDWGPNPHPIGVAYTVDYHPPLPRFLEDLNIEGQGRNLIWHRGAAPVTGAPIVPRTFTLGGGLIYHPHWVRFHKFEPYAKGLLSYGNIHFAQDIVPYNHDTRTVSSIGGGVDYRLIHRVTLRADYEYQWWPDFLGPNALNPNGFTISALYNFGHR
ncbi:outer membrane beta-barrel protein [Terracidiphilus gabretensis]|jgi:opacity protein-like surface antigen|uniref:outer membrane beta-barrel protein n=1 Tax=Terracidiphilus gabretensis TaxID=1577687 RepID=UPI00071B97E2|nr:outer membrane beta-barrel protein [Terracidiphilus gabretensis]